MLKELFRFIYTREVVGLTELAEPLLAAANKFLVDDLKSICAVEIRDQITVDNVIILMTYANEHNCMEVEDYTAQFIAR